MDEKIKLLTSLIVLATAVLNLVTASRARRRTARKNRVAGRKPLSTLIISMIGGNYQ